MLLNPSFLGIFYRRARLLELGILTDFHMYRSSTSAAEENPTKSKLSVVLLCLPTDAVSDLYSSLITSNPTAEGMATAIAGLETAWPRDGTLLLDMNKEGIYGKTWLPYDIVGAPIRITYFVFMTISSTRRIPPYLSM